MLFFSHAISKMQSEFDDMFNLNGFEHMRLSFTSVITSIIHWSWNEVNGSTAMQLKQLPDTAVYVRYEISSNGTKMRY